MNAAKTRNASSWEDVSTETGLQCEVRQYLIVEGQLRMKNTLLQKVKLVTSGLTKLYHLFMDQNLLKVPEQRSTILPMYATIGQNLRRSLRSELTLVDFLVSHCRSELLTRFQDSKICIIEYNTSKTSRNRQEETICDCSMAMRISAQRLICRWET